jgi:hypothetical protein
MTRFPTPKTVLRSIALTLILSVIGSGLWDFLFKPGITVVGRSLLTIITFGSETIRDLAYASAALNPTPLPALAVFLIASYVPLFFFGWLTGNFVGDRLGDKSIQDAESEASGDNEKLIALLESKLRKLKRRRDLFIGIFLIVLCFFSLTTSAILNQSVAIWRVFHANLTICSPYITEIEEKKLQSRFASMVSRKEYLALANNLNEIAQRNGIKLQQAQLW